MDVFGEVADVATGLRLTGYFLEHWVFNHHRTGASNGPVEAANLLIKQIKRHGRGFRNLDNYRLRILLAGGQHQRETHQVTRLRPRRPRSVA